MARDDRINANAVPGRTDHGWPRLARVVEDADGRLVEVLMAGDVAALLGISRQRVHQLASRRDFPPPLDGPSAGGPAMWARLDVEEWRLRKRRSGRPAEAPDRPTGYAMDIRVAFDPRFAPSPGRKQALAETMSGLASRGLVELEVLWLGDGARVRLGVVAMTLEEATATACKIVQLRVTLGAGIAPEWATTVTVESVEELGQYVG